MKIILLISMLMILLSSCGDKSSVAETEISNARCPIIMIAESEVDENYNYATITLVDSDGRIYSYACKSPFTASISETFEPGDTVIHCRCL